MSDNIPGRKTYFLLVGDEKRSFVQIFHYLFMKRGCPRGVMVKALDCGIVVREFELQSRYYVHFRERYEPPYSPSYGLNSTTTVLLGEWLWH